MTAAIQQNAAPADVVTALQALSTLKTGTSVYGAIAAITASNTPPTTVCDAAQVSHFAATSFSTVSVTPAIRYFRVIAGAGDQCFNAACTLVSTYKQVYYYVVLLVTSTCNILYRGYAPM
jgi:hypothetical protein